MLCDCGGAPTQPRVAGEDTEPHPARGFSNGAGGDRISSEVSEGEAMNRMAGGAALVIALAAQLLAQAPRYDLVLKGGHVIDPANSINEVRDVAIQAGKIAAVEKAIPPSNARKSVDATGFYVTPGLVDIHVHIGNGGAPLNWFEPSADSHIPPLGILADTVLNSGVTTIVDAGSSGAKTFLREKQEVIDHSRVRVLALLNIVAAGMNSGKEQDVSEMDPQLCADTIHQ